jgi:hypothetical protein
MIKVGAFSIPREFVFDNPGAVKQCMGRCIILRAECMAAYNRIDYIAICDDFEPVKDGDLALEYMPHFHLDGDDGVFEGFSKAIRPIS